METLMVDLNHVVPKLVDSVTSEDDITYRLYVIDKVRKAREAIVHGDRFSIEDLKGEMESW